MIMAATKNNAKPTGRGSVPNAPAEVPATVSGCERCGGVLPDQHHSRRFCETCGIERKREHHRAYCRTWRKANPDSQRRYVRRGDHRQPMTEEIATPFSCRELLNAVLGCIVAIRNDPEHADRYEHNARTLIGVLHTRVRKKPRERQNTETAEPAPVRGLAPAGAPSGAACRMLTHALEINDE